MKPVVVMYEEDLFSIRFISEPTPTCKVALMWIDSMGLHLKEVQGA